MMPTTRPLPLLRGQVAELCEKRTPPPPPPPPPATQQVPPPRLRSHRFLRKTDPGVRDKTPFRLRDSFPSLLPLLT